MPLIPRGGGMNCGCVTDRNRCSLKLLWKETAESDGVCLWVLFSPKTLFIYFTSLLDYISSYPPPQKKWSPFVLRCPHPPHHCCQNVCYACTPTSSYMKVFIMHPQDALHYYLFTNAFSFWCFWGFGICYFESLWYFSKCYKKMNSTENRRRQHHL